MTKATITIADLWGEFERMVVPPDAGARQIQETRRAFYAGCHVTLMTMRDLVALLEEDQAVEVLEGLHAECRAFGQAIQEGKA